MNDYSPRSRREQCRFRFCIRVSSADYEHQKKIEKQSYRNALPFCSHCSLIESYRALDDLVLIYVLLGV